MKIFSKNLKHLMKAKGLTVEGLSCTLRCPTTTVRAWIEARAYPRIPKLLDLCDALDYYDIYKLMKVDMRSGKVSERDGRLRADVSQALTQIKVIAEGMLR